MKGPLAGAILLAVAAIQPPDDSFPVLVEISRAGTQTAATASLIHRHQEPTGTALYFLTAGHLFREPTGARLPNPDAVGIVGRGRTVAVRPQDVILPPGTVVDIALLRVVVADTNLQPAAATSVAPAPGEEFRVKGFGADGAPLESVQRVRIKTSALAEPFLRRHAPGFAMSASSTEPDAR
jgi:hypothetical protein